MLGLSPDAAPPTSFSLGIAAAPELQKKVAEAAAFPILKIKLGAHERDGISDREILRTVRAAAPDKRLRIDPNEGWTLERAREHFAFLKTLPGPPIELCEQPLPASDRAGLAALFRDRDRPPVLLDESLIDARDLPGGRNRIVTGRGRHYNFVDVDCPTLIARGCRTEFTLHTSLPAETDFRPVIERLVGFPFAYEITQVIPWHHNQIGRAHV